MQTFYAAFARLRADYPALRRGAFTTLLAGETTPARGDDDIYAFLRIPLRGAFPGSTRSSM
jgi:hypothetical protein